MSEQVTITLSIKEWDEVLMDMSFAASNGDCTDGDGRRSWERYKKIARHLPDWDPKLD